MTHLPICSHKCTPIYTVEPSTESSYSTFLKESLACGPCTGDRNANPQVCGQPSYWASSPLTKLTFWQLDRSISLEKLTIALKLLSGNPLVWIISLVENTSSETRPHMSNPSSSSFWGQQTKIHHFHYFQVGHCLNWLWRWMPQNYNTFHQPYLYGWMQ